MSALEYLSTNAPITNYPDLLGWHHNNPLGIHPVAQLFFILIVVGVMAYFNFQIRKRGKSQYYPVLYSLLAVSLVSIFYYCFQSFDSPEYLVPLWKYEYVGARPCIGWFCHPANVGWFWTIFSVIALVFVIYSLLNAVMQTVAQMSVEAKLIDAKPWKEWKAGVYLALAGVVICGICYFLAAEVSAWSLIIFEAVMLCFIIGKMIMDSIRCKNPLWGIAIALVFYFGIIASIMLTIECMRGTVAFFVAVLIILSKAKASKKKVKTEAPAE